MIIERTNGLMGMIECVSYWNSMLSQLMILCNTLTGHSMILQLIKWWNTERVGVQ